MAPITIPVRSPSAHYDIEIGANLLPSIGDRLDALLRTAHGEQAGGLHSGKQRAFVVSSPEILRLHGQSLLSGLPSSTIVLEVPPGEQHKRLPTVEALLEQLAQHGADRDSILIAFGGGVLGDMTGFLAAIYMRGIRYIQVPTTALAQIDSSIGGKTGVNLAAGKNLAGAFHHPLAVFTDTSLLTTLPPAELRAGLQEAIKAGIIRDAALFDYLEANSASILAGEAAALTHVIAASVRVKAEIVSLDERESGLRMVLNLGHTLGHAIESATHYNQLLHGEAVAWGMLAALAIAKRRGLVTIPEHDRVEHVVITYGPLKRFQADAAQLVALTAKDKKNRSGDRKFILPRGIGDAVVVNDITLDELTLTAERMLAMAATEGVA